MTLSSTAPTAPNIPPLDPPVTAELVLALLAAQGRARDDALVQQVVDAAANMQRVLARLRAAGDVILGEVHNAAELPGEQVAAAERALTRVIEHTEALMLVRQSVTALTLPADDAEIVALIATADAIAEAVMAAVHA
ncbi:MAG TPA: hypothetical protein VGD46_22590 [Rhizobacter sp.]